MLFLAFFFDQVLGAHLAVEIVVAGEGNFSLALCHTKAVLLQRFEGVDVNALGEVADTIVMSPQVFNRLRRSTLMQNFIRGNRPSDSTLNVTTGAMQQAFQENGIQNIYVGQARYDSAKKGQSFSSAQVWGNTYVWVGSVKGGDFSAGGAGRTLVWNPEGGLYVTETYRNDQRRSNVVRVRQFAGEHVVNGAAGTLITTSYS